MTGELVGKLGSEGTMCYLCSPSPGVTFHGYEIEWGIVIYHRYCKDQKKMCGDPISYRLIASMQCEYLPLLLTEAHPCLVCQEKILGSKDKCKIHKQLIYTEE